MFIAKLLGGFFDFKQLLQNFISEWEVAIVYLLFPEALSYLGTATEMLPDLQLSFDVLVVCALVAWSPFVCLSLHPGQAFRNI